ncbi:hypothetical protein LIER_19240 [Lithospermum erythrorhizon]|uniref:Uncharacterized protein n=1 Tax=Lithospermum erythrorhizon TaxID=34254 RepID=A0AAV3QJZ3_LITER
MSLVTSVCYLMSPICRFVPLAYRMENSTVHLKCGLVLNKVLFVLDFDCNLLSVSHLAADLNYVLQFTNNLCVVQDRTLRTLIGVGEQRGGLYYLRDEPVVRVMAVEKLNELWHNGWDILRRK